MKSPLTTTILFHVGPIPITTPVVVTWAIMLVLAIGGFAATRRLSLTPSRFQATLEMIVETIRFPNPRYACARRRPPIAR